MSIGCDKCGKEHDEGISVPSEETWCVECAEKHGIQNPDVLPSTELACSATAENTLVRAQGAIDRMAKALKAGKGVRISWEELNELNCSLLGEWFGSENPCLKK